MNLLGAAEGTGRSTDLRTKHATLAQCKPQPHGALAGPSTAPQDTPRRRAGSGQRRYEALGAQPRLPWVPQRPHRSPWVPQSQAVGESGPILLGQEQQRPACARTRRQAPGGTGRSVGAPHQAVSSLRPGGGETCRNQRLRPGPGQDAGPLRQAAPGASGSSVPRLPARPGSHGVHAPPAPPHLPRASPR